MVGRDADRITLGHTLPRGTHPSKVLLEGRAVHDYRIVTTNRGAEATVSSCAGKHTLTVIA